MEGRHASKEQFCFLLGDYGVDIKLLNIDMTLLPSKYTRSHINAPGKVKKEVHRLVGIIFTLSTS